MMTSKLFSAVNDLFEGENLFEVIDFERGFVGKFLQSPGHLASLVNNLHEFTPSDHELSVFFVNDDQIVVGQLLFTTDNSEVPFDLGKSDFVEGFISESADDLDEWSTITVAYGTHFNSLDIESWASNWFESDHVLDVIDIKDGRWSSGMCQGNGCCPVDGTEIKPLSYYEGDSAVTESSESVNLDELLDYLNDTIAQLVKE